MKYSIIRFYFYLLVIFLTKQSMVSGECTCEKDDQPQDGKSITLKYKLASIGAILGTSAIGVTLPLLGNRVPVLKPENDIFFMIKAFAAGVILATGFIHILPEAFEGLTSPCIGETPWQKFPFASFIAMVAAIGSLMVDTLATGHYRRVHYEESGNKNKNNNNININNKVVDEESNDEHANHVHVHSHATHGHAHGHGGGSLVGNNGDFGEQSSKLDLIRHRVTAQVLELGVLVHSVIIGISLGTSQSLDTIKPLMVALCFHQFFEGMGLGGCILQAKFKSQATLTMAIFFSLTTPIGIAIGIAIAGVYDENNARSLIIQGIFEAAAAGILIYMALVDLLAADFMNPRMQANSRIQLGSHLSLLLGAGCMSVLAKWA